MSVTSMGEARRNRGRRDGSPAARRPRPSSRSSPRGSSRSKPLSKSKRTVRSYTRLREGPARLPGRSGHASGCGGRGRRAPSRVPAGRRAAHVGRVGCRALPQPSGCSSAGWRARRDRSNPNPMARIEGPKVNKKAKTFFSDDELARLLKTCQGSSFVDRRDTAIMRVLIDTGLRVSGLANLRYDLDDESHNDVFLTRRRLRIRLKGGDETWGPIGKKAAAALDRYIRVRARHAQASSPWLWLGVQGHNTAHMTDSGIRDMVGRRGEQAGIQNVHPHRFRRSFADKWLEAGGSTDDLMHITGWKTYDMVREYTEPAASPGLSGTRTSQPWRSDLDEPVPAGLSSSRQVCVLPREGSQSPEPVCGLS